MMIASWSGDRSELLTIISSGWLSLVLLWMQKDQWVFIIGADRQACIWQPYPDLLTKLENNNSHGNQWL